MKRISLALKDHPEFYYYNAVLFVLIANIGMSFKGILAKFAYEAGAGVLSLLVVRFIFAIPLFWLPVLAKKNKITLGSLGRKDFLICGIAGFLFFLSAYTDFMSLTLIDASVERIVFFSYPAFIMFIEFLVSKKPITRKQIGCFCLAEAGIVLVMGIISKENLFRENVVGTLWAIASAITYAAYFVISQPAIKRVGSMNFTVLANTVTFIFISCHFTASENISNLSMEKEAYFYIFIMAIFCTVLPFFMIFHGIKRLGASRVSMIAMISPTITLLMAHLLLDEKMDPFQMIGVAFVVLSIWLLERKTPNKYVEIPNSNESQGK